MFKLGGCKEAKSQNHSPVAAGAQKAFMTHMAGSAACNYLYIAQGLAVATLLLASQSDTPQ